MESIKRHMDSLDEEEKRKRELEELADKERIRKEALKEKMKKIQETIQELERNPVITEYLKLRKELANLDRIKAGTSRVVVDIGPSDSWTEI